MLGVSMMIMGAQLREINERSVEPLAQELAREELRKKKLNSAEKAKEFYALLFSFISFLVHLCREVTYIGSLGRRGGYFQYD